jgi:hypothetical protein
MSKIMAKLANRPNEPLTFDHNGQIKELMLALGIENSFTQLPPKSPTGRTIQMVQHIFHPTHFIVIHLALGYDDPKENGYFATCLPKSKYSPEQCQEFFKAIGERASTGQVLDAGIRWSRKPGHSSN